MSESMQMKTVLLGIGLVFVGLACSEGTALRPPFKPVEVDLTQPGKICEVHNLPLQSGKVPIHYGKPAGPTEEEKQRKRAQFPNSNSYIWGGGCVVDENRLWAKASFCTECRKEEEVWRNEQYKSILRDEDR
jgi:hypothetical protein